MKDLQKENILIKDENANLERIKQELEEKVMELEDELVMVSDHQFTSVSLERLQISQIQHCYTKALVKHIIYQNLKF